MDLPYKMARFALGDEALAGASWLVMNASTLARGLKLSLRQATSVRIIRLMQIFKLIPPKLTQ